MTRELILRNRLEMANHNLYCYSGNYLCTIPKQGKEKEFIEATAEVAMLEAWLKEFHRSNTNSTREFVGHISGWSGGRTYDDQPLAKDLIFVVDTGASYLDGDRRTFGIAPEVQDWFIGKHGKCGKYDIEKNQRNSRLVKITVDKIEYVRAIEWVVAEDAE
ncbi:MAG: hypothetical protein FWE91_12620 [Defluviitaleaceae bacterium]|nr:hypothetical protein [Defluviitaleaceae bacterium]MCL2836692.1 hypothetical protein [Defluviitaleaceae bacterium]